VKLVLLGEAPTRGRVAERLRDDGCGVVGQADDWAAGRAIVASAAPELVVYEHGVRDGEQSAVPAHTGPRQPATPTLPDRATRRDPTPYVRTAIELLRRRRVIGGS
jgi:hypothetical protein